ncbi:Low molecular weight protein-tyrosine-phosphatase PtpA [compost metagenome]
MDRENLAGLARLRPDAGAKLRLLMSFATRHDADEVPDPYYGEGDGFERVLDYIEDACDGLVAQLRQRLQGNAG